MGDQLILDSEIDQVIKYECKINDWIVQDNNCYVHFEYCNINGNQYQLKIITYNRIHQKSFIFKDFIGNNKMILLQTAYQYITRNIQTENNYKVNWTDSNQQYISYFHGKNKEEVLTKLYCSIDNIQNIQINQIIPIS